MTHPVCGRLFEGTCGTVVLRLNDKLLLTFLVNPALSDFVFPLIQPSSPKDSTLVFRVQIAQFAVSSPSDLHASFLCTLQGDSWRASPQTRTPLYEQKPRMEHRVLTDTHIVVTNVRALCRLRVLRDSRRSEGNPHWKLVSNLYGIGWRKMPCRPILAANRRIEDEIHHFDTRFRKPQCALAYAAVHGRLQRVEPGQLFAVQRALAHGSLRFLACVPAAHLLEWPVGIGHEVQRCDDHE